MAQHESQSSGNPVAAGNPRQGSRTATGRGESDTIGPAGTQSNDSTSSGRSSNESDSIPHGARPGHSSKPLTMGSNGGGADSDMRKENLEQSINRGGNRDRKVS